MEIGVALWFPCVLWNCIRPEQLWCLNPKKILNALPPLRDGRQSSKKSDGDDARTKKESTSEDGEEES